VCAADERVVAGGTGVGGTVAEAEMDEEEGEWGGLED
jgi:hypothetical protein